MNNKLCALGSLMSRKSWWKWALFGLLALYSLLLVSRCSPIEQDLQSRTSEALNDKGLSWATPLLEKRGRDVMLSGEAPSEEARELAINTAADVYGVRIVENDITLKQYSTPEFGLNNEDGKTTLTGSFPKQDLIDQAVRAASDNFGADNVVNKMTVSDDVSSPSWLPATLAVLPAIVAMKDADLDINNDASSINGTFHTEEEKQSFLALAGTAFGDKFTDNSVVKPLGPTPEELAEIARKVEEEEAARLAEEKRLAEEAEVARLAEAAKVSEEKRLAEEAEAARLAEEKRLAEEAEATRIANEKSMAAILLAAEKAREAKAEEARLAEEKRLSEEAEEARLAEEKRLAEEAEAARMANEKSMAAIMLAAEKAREAKAEEARLAEEKRLAQEAEAARMANEKSMAAIMLAAEKAREAKAARQAEAAHLAEVKRLADEARLARIADAKSRSACQQAINDTMSGKRVLFATSSARIDSKSYPLLNTLAERISNCGKNIQVGGHTDSRGSEEMNMKLSENRALSVRTYLENQGVGTSVISSKGYGETSPIADNNSVEGRRLNRRIQFTILK